MSNHAAASQTRFNRDTLIAVGAGLLVLIFVLLATLTVSKRVTSTRLTGVIENKIFRAQSETQISIGQQGLQQRQVAGDYIFEVRVPSDNSLYSIWVDKTVYDSHNIGDRYSFLPPPPSPAESPSPSQK
jgi:hypothetical protein